MVKEWQVLSDGALGCYAYGCHSRLRENGLFKPLDSGLRRNDGGRIPVFACLLQAGRGQAAEEARKIMPGYL